MIPIDEDAFRRELNVDKCGLINTTITKINIALERSKVDAVEVVRCRDCKEFEAIGYCLFWGDDVDADGYCSCGERGGE